MVLAIEAVREGNGVIKKRRKEIFKIGEFWYVSETKNSFTHDSTSKGLKNIIVTFPGNDGKIMKNIDKGYNHNCNSLNFNFFVTLFFK